MTFNKSQIELNINVLKRVPSVYFWQLYILVWPQEKGELLGSPNNWDCTYDESLLFLAGPHTFSFQLFLPNGPLTILYFFLKKKLFC